MSGLIWVQTVCKGYQQTTLVEFNDAFLRRKIVRDKFLGCMKSLQVGFETVNLWEGKATVGVTEGCKESVSHFVVPSR